MSAGVGVVLPPVLASRLAVIAAAESLTVRELVVAAVWELVRAYRPDAVPATATVSREPAARPFEPLLDETEFTMLLSESEHGVPRFHRLRR